MCERLQCGDKATLRERIFCRLNLAPAGIARELQIEYLPEACRAKAVGAARNECIRYYKNYQPCWQSTGIRERLQCARGVLKLRENVAEERQACDPKAATACRTAIRDKVYDLIKFRFYELEQRAEALGARGAHLDTIADFVTTAEQKKQDFDAATTTAARRQIILDIRQAWQTFMATAKTQIK